MPFDLLGALAATDDLDGLRERFHLKALALAGRSAPTITRGGRGQVEVRGQQSTSAAGKAHPPRALPLSARSGTDETLDFDAFCELMTANSATFRRLLRDVGEDATLDTRDHPFSRVPHPPTGQGAPARTPYPSPSSSSSTSSMSVLDLFCQMDCDGDGRISWDDMYNLAVDTAAAALRPLPAEFVPPYGFSRLARRADNVYFARHLPTLGAIVTSSRHAPMQLLAADTFAPLPGNRGTIETGSGAARLLSVAYCPQPTALFAYYGDMVLRGWILGDGRQHVHPLAPLHCAAHISDMAVPVSRPSLLFAADSAGFVTVYEPEKVTHDPPRVLDTIALHSSGIANMCFVTPHEQRIVTAGHDRALCITDLINRKRTLVGHSDCSTRWMRYSTMHQLIATVSTDDDVALWVTHPSRRPNTVLVDSAEPHRAAIIGLEAPDHSHEVITTDRDGLIKVWDVRMLRCTQSLRAGTCPPTEELGAVGAAAAHDTTVDTRAQLGERGSNTFFKEDHQNISSATYCGTTKELIVSSSTGLWAHRSGEGTDATVADDTSATIRLACNTTMDSIVSISARSLRVWDSEELYLSVVRRITAPTPQQLATRWAGIHGTAPGAPVFDVHNPEVQAFVSKHRYADFTALALDKNGRRVFVGFSSGDVEIQSYHGGGVMRRFTVHEAEVSGLAYCDRHRILASISHDGTAVIVSEGEQDLTGGGGASVTRCPISKSPLLSVAICSDLSLLAVGTAAGRVMVADVRYPRVPLFSHAAPALGAVRDLCFLGGFPLLVSAHAAGEICIWSVRPVHNAALVAEINLNALLRRFKNPNASVRASCFESLNAMIHSTEAEPPTPTTIAFDVASHWLYIGDSTGYVTVAPLCPLLCWLKASRTTFPPILSPESAEPRGRLVFEHGNPKKLQRKIDVIYSVQAHAREVFSLQIFERHGQPVVISCGDDGAVNLWADPEKSGPGQHARRGGRNKRGASVAALRQVGALDMTTLPRSMQSVRCEKATLGEALFAMQPPAAKGAAIAGGGGGQQSSAREVTTYCEHLAPRAAPRSSLRSSMRADRFSLPAVVVHEADRPTGATAHRDSSRASFLGVTLPCDDEISTAASSATEITEVLGDATASDDESPRCIQATQRVLRCTNPVGRVATAADPHSPHRVFSVLGNSRRESGMVHRGGPVASVVEGTAIVSAPVPVPPIERFGICRTNADHLWTLYAQQEHLVAKERFRTRRLSLSLGVAPEEVALLPAPEAPPVPEPALFADATFDEQRAARLLANAAHPPMPRPPATTDPATIAGSDEGEPLQQRSAITKIVQAAVPTSPRGFVPAPEEPSRTAPPHMRTYYRPLRPATTFSRDDPDWIAAAVTHQPAPMCNNGTLPNPSRSTEGEAGTSSPRPVTAPRAPQTVVGIHSRPSTRDGLVGLLSPRLCRGAAPLKAAQRPSGASGVSGDGVAESPHFERSAPTRSTAHTARLLMQRPPTAETLPTLARSARDRLFFQAVGN